MLKNSLPFRFIIPDAFVKAEVLFNRLAVISIFLISIAGSVDKSYDKIRTSVDEKNLSWLTHTTAPSYSLIAASRISLELISR